MDITVTPQGPYVVKGAPPHRARPLSSDQGEPLAWEHDPPLRADGEYALCRCGGSSSKPFCDGTHETRDWDGTETAPTSTYDERAKAVRGQGITVRDDKSLCEHAGFCATRTTNVWALVREGGSTEARSQVAGMVERCPSGRLTYRVEGADHDLEPPLAEGVAVVDDGPLWVTGGVPVTRADGAPFEARARVTLCRCGASKNKPLCDGSHASVGFADS